MEGAERIEGWTGPVSRSRQTIIQPGDSANSNCGVVNFSQGCTTGWHTHNCDQVLVGRDPQAPAWWQPSMNSMKLMWQGPVNAIGMAPSAPERKGDGVGVMRALTGHGEATHSQLDPDEADAAAIAAAALWLLVS
jgi:hypothetical protein